MLCELLDGPLVNQWVRLACLDSMSEKFLDGVWETTKQLHTKVSLQHGWWFPWLVVSPECSASLNLLPSIYSSISRPWSHVQFGLGRILYNLQRELLPGNGLLRSKVWVCLPSHPLLFFWANVTRSNLKVLLQVAIVALMKMVVAVMMRGLCSIAIVPTCNSSTQQAKSKELWIWGLSYMVLKCDNPTHLYIWFLECHRLCLLSLQALEKNKFPLHKYFPTLFCAQIHHRN